MFGTGELVGEECSRKCKDFKITAVDKLTPGKQSTYKISSIAVISLEPVWLDGLRTRVLCFGGELQLVLPRKVGACPSHTPSFRARATPFPSALSI